MKVLFLSYDGLTDPLGRSQILPYLQGLSKEGRQFHVLSCEKVETYRIHRETVAAICRHYGIEWTWLPFPENKGMLSQFRLLRDFTRLALAIAMKEKTGLVHCRSYPAALTGLRIRKKLGIPWIFDIRGFWIDERKEGKIWNTGNPAVRLVILLFRMAERSLFRQADTIVSLTDKGKEIIENKFFRGISARPVRVIPCCTDFKVFNPGIRTERNSVRNRLNIPSDAFVLTYLGSIGTWYLLEEMLDFFKLLTQSKPGSYFLFITNEQPDKIRVTAGKKGVSPESLRITSALHGEVPALLGISDWGIALIRPTWSKQASSPVKWAEFLASGIPLVVNKGIGDVDSLQHRLPGLVAIAGFTESEYSRAISMLCDTRVYDRETISSQARQVFDLPIAIKSYSEAYRAASNKKVLIIASHRPDRAPNQRFRFEQYFGFLQNNGFSCQLAYIIHAREDAFMYQNGHFLKKALFFYVKSWIRRWKVLKVKDHYDLIIIAREALMTRSTYFERHLRRSRAAFVFDFDDSIWLSNVSAANRYFHWLKNPGKTSSIISMSDLVIAGNQYLEKYASEFNSKVVVIPTCVDTDEFRPTNHPSSENIPVVIGWTGSITTIPHLGYIESALLSVKEKYGDRIRYLVVGDENYMNSRLDIKGLPWSLDTEKQLLSRFDIGIMPLPDNKWTRGKCGFKGLLCMAMGIPVIMSPVGVNSEIITDGVNGFLAEDHRQWVEKLSLLIESSSLRKQLGARGRETVVEHYSVNAWKNKYLELFSALTGKPC
ncbi:MAG: glycosyltransferase [Bacteroidetes bacterium]|nr:glycosyltransferase [Bacteroidota bacterium]